MASQKIGTTKSGRGKLYDVRWDSFSGDVYVNYAGGTHVGKAKDAAQAMHMAIAWLSQK